MSNPQSSFPTVVITGGGTGGHLYPALSVAEEVRSMRPDWSIQYIGRANEKEQTEVKNRGFNFLGLPLKGLKRKFSLSNIVALGLFFKGIFFCALQMKKWHKGIVFGVGGYVSAPAMIAGKLLGWPVTLHEQNTIPGLVNRTLAKMCTAVFLTFEKTREYLREGSIMISGMPVRPELMKLKKPRSQTDQKTVSILVIGGSQGARKLVEVTAEAFSMLEKKQTPHQALLQTGERNYEWALTLPHSSTCKMIPFIMNMAEAYNDAHIVISRAGSGSLAEIAYWGLPSILVPYPYASENHQKVNAEVFERSGAAVLMEEKSITPDRMAKKLEHLINDIELRIEMSRKASELSKKDSAHLIANQLIKIVEDRL